MKKIVAILLVLLALCVAATPETIAETGTNLDPGASDTTSEGIALEPYGPVLSVGETMELKASGAESILWFSSDVSIATVDEAGLVTAVAPGEVTITACSAMDSSVRVDATILVGVHVETVELEETELTLLADTPQADYDLIPRILPENASMQTVTYASSNEAILTVEESGRLHAVAPGTATVTVTPADTACTASAQLKVTVKQGVTNIELSKTEADLYLNEKLTLNAKVLPQNASNKKCVWSSSNESVAEVGQNGAITPKGEGSAVIRCTAEDGSGIFSECTVNVTVAAQKVTLDANNVTLLLDGPQELAMTQLQATVAPENATVRDITWTSSNEAIATVSDTGLIHAVSAGKAAITASSADPRMAGKVKAVCNVTVGSAVTGMELSKTEADLYLNEKLTLTAKVLPQNAVNKKCVWSSSNESVAEVNSNGAVTPKGEGTAVIRCAAEDGSGVFSECTVNVTVGIQKITLDTTNATLLVGGPQELGRVQLQYTVAPENTSFKAVTWTSSDVNVATVDSNGLVHAVSAGKATITAATTDPRAADRIKTVCNVTVGNAVRGITLEGGDSRVQKGKSVKFTAKLNPEKPFNGKLQWTSSNENILKVDANGNVRAINVGTATITVKATDGSKVSVSKQITVYQPVTQLSPVEKGTIIMFAGQSKTLHVNAGPADATDKRVTWESSKSSGLRVDSSGGISGLSAGTYTITATAVDGSKKSCKFTIIVEPKVPISLESLGFGIYNANLLGITVKNKCARTTIKNFDFKIVLYTYDGSMLNTSGIYNLGKDATISPNATKTIKRSMSGVSWAQRITITIVGVTLSDGTYYSIPSSAQETWTFRR